MNEMNTVPQHADVVVVGGGLAGLAAATYLGRAHRSVVVLERSSEIGGRAISDNVEGYWLDRGAHALYTGGPATRVMRELGIRYTFGTPNRVFARDRNGIHQFPDTVAHMWATDVFNAAEKRDLVALMVRASTARPEHLGSQSVARWLEHATRLPRVRELAAAMARVFLYSAALDIVSADTFVARFQQALRHPIHYVDGGWQTLVDGFKATALAAGASLMTSAAVSELLIDEGKASGVHLRNGQEIVAAAVLLAVPPREAERLLGDRGARLTEGLSTGYLACLDLALDQLPRPVHPVVFDLEEPRFITAQSSFARLAPPDRAVVHAFKVLDPRAVPNANQDRVDLERYLDEVQPGWRDHVVRQQFLPRMEASAWVPLADHGGLAGRPPYHSVDIDNLYFAGDWVGPRGYLIDTVLESARQAARMRLARHGRPAGSSRRPNLVEPMRPAA
jgi:phytoene dehydrogenase-like protein